MPAEFLEIDTVTPLDPSAITGCIQFTGGEADQTVIFDALETFLTARGWEMIHTYAPTSKMFRAPCLPDSNGVVQYKYMNPTVSSSYLYNYIYEDWNGSSGINQFYYTNQSSWYAQYLGNYSTQSFRLYLSASARHFWMFSHCNNYSDWGTSSYGGPTSVHEITRDHVIEDTVANGYAPPVVAMIWSRAAYPTSYGACIWSDPKGNISSTASQNVCIRTPFTHYGAMGYSNPYYAIPSYNESYVNAQGRPLTFEMQFGYSYNGHSSLGMRGTICGVGGLGLTGGYAGDTITSKIHPVTLTPDAVNGVEQQCGIFVCCADQNRGRLILPR